MPGSRPVPVAGLAAALLIAWGCSSDAIDGLPHGTIQVGIAPADTLAHDLYSGVTERRRQVIRSAAGWVAAWNTIHANVQPQPELPAVDFDSSVVLVLATGTRNSGGYDIGVDDIRRAGATLAVVVRETAPGDGCFTTAALSAPVIALRVPAPADSAEFFERATVRDCR